jgi:hypothetical protein
MSELSTVAIKDGHRGHLSHSHHNPMDAERADRISRLPGLDRVQPARHSTPSAANSANPYYPATQGYFDANNAPQITRERSTVGSASATGSQGGRTTAVSGSDFYDHDKMSEDTQGDMDVDTSSLGGFSEESVSLVGFGEGARTPARQLSSVGSPAPGNKAGIATPSAIPPSLRQQQLPVSPVSGISSLSVEAQKQSAKMIDGMTYDRDFGDTVNRTPPPVEDGMAGDGGDGAATVGGRMLPDRRLRSHLPAARSNDME